MDVPKPQPHGTYRFGVPSPANSKLGGVLKLSNQGHSSFSIYERPGSRLFMDLGPTYYGKPCKDLPSIVSTNISSFLALNITKCTRGYLVFR